MIVISHVNTFIRVVRNFLSSYDKFLLDLGSMKSVSIILRMLDGLISSFAVTPCTANETLLLTFKALAGSMGGFTSPCYDSVTELSIIVILIDICYANYAPTKISLDRKRAVFISRTYMSLFQSTWAIVTNQETYITVKNRWYFTCIRSQMRQFACCISRRYVASVHWNGSPCVCVDRHIDVVIVSARN